MTKAFPSADVTLAFRLLRQRGSLQARTLMRLNLWTRYRAIRALDACFAFGYCTKKRRNIGRGSAWEYLYVPKANRA